MLGLWGGDLLVSLLFHMAHPAAQLPHLTRVSVLLGHPVVLTPKREAQKMYFEAATGMSFMFAINTDHREGIQLSQQGGVAGGCTLLKLAQSTAHLEVIFSKGTAFCNCLPNCHYCRTY